MESELAAAGAIAALVVAQRDQWMGCSGAEDLDCAREVADTLIARAYRRPPTPRSASGWRRCRRRVVRGGDFASALEELVQALLISPQFLYRLELGREAGEPGELVALDDYELASRLSYFLWQTMPDEELFDLAAEGELSASPTCCARRPSGCSRVRARAPVVADFHRQWLELDRLDLLRLDPAPYPELDDALRQALRGSLEAYVAWAFWEERSVEALFGADRVYANAALAPLLDVTASGAGLAPPTAPHRKGLLTQPGLLASTSHGTLALAGPARRPDPAPLPVRDHPAAAAGRQHRARASCPKARRAPRASTSRSPTAGASARRATT